MLRRLVLVPVSVALTALAVAPLAGRATAVRIIQTNAAGDNAHVIDPATNKVVGIIRDVEIVHGVTSAPDGRYIYLTNESLHTLDVVDGKTLAVTKRIHLSGRPNNVAVTNDGRKVYVGIAQAPGALDVIDMATLTNVKTRAGHRLDPQRLRDARTASSRSPARSRRARSASSTPPPTPWCGPSR